MEGRDMKEVMLFFSLVILLMIFISVAGIRVLVPLFPVKQRSKVLWLLLGGDVLSIAGIAGSKTIFRELPFCCGRDKSDRHLADVPVARHCFFLSDCRGQLFLS